MSEWKSASDISLRNHFIQLLTTCDTIRIERLYKEAWASVHTTPSQVAELLPTTTSPSTEHDELRMQIVQELNFVRTDPKGYIIFVEKHLSYFQDLIYTIPGQRSVQTKEGTDAFFDCIEALENSESMPPLCLELGMTQAATDHATYLGTSGKCQHQGQDGNSMTDRLDRYGEWKGCSGENISLGVSTASSIVLQLLVDDGVSNRGHRLNILNKDFHVIGIGMQKHTKMDMVCVMDFAGGYGPKSNKLQYATKACATGEMTIEVQAILNSIPFPEMKMEITRVLKNEKTTTVELEYTTTSITVVYNRPDGTVTQKGTWGVQAVNA